MAALRAAHPVFRRQQFFQGRPIHGSSVDDIAWLRLDGQQMSDDDWNGGSAQSLAIFLIGHGIPDRDKVRQGVVDDSFPLLINAHHQKVTFVLPHAAYGAAWEVVVDTADPLLAHPLRRPLGPGDRQRLLCCPPPNLTT